MATVLLEIEDNPKRTNSGAWHRYNLYERGRTEEDLLAMGLTKADLKWDTAQGHVKFGEGERLETPLPAPPAAAEPKPRGGGRAAPPPTPAPSTVPALTATGSSESPYIVQQPAVSIRAPGPSDTEHLASWYKTPVLVEVVAEAGPQSREWRVVVTTKDGAKRWRTVGSDKLALALVGQILSHGYDPDSWTEEHDGKPGL